MKSALDSAFLRRLRFMAVFDSGPRGTQNHLDKKGYQQHRRQGLDFDLLAKLNHRGRATFRQSRLNETFSSGSGKNTHPTVDTMHLTWMRRGQNFGKLDTAIHEADFSGKRSLGRMWS